MDLGKVNILGYAHDLIDGDEFPEKYRGKKETEANQ